jgi:hypothetical protein
MTMPRLSFEDLIPPVSNLERDFPEAMRSWTWLVPQSARPLLVTVLGDVFVELKGEVFFLDSELGRLVRVADSREEWKKAMQDPERLAEWFRPALVSQVVERGLVLQAGEVFSPLVPAIVGGKRGPENFTTSQWMNHLHILGQIHDQVRRLPPGTRIDRLVVDPVE